MIVLAVITCIALALLIGWIIVDCWNDPWMGN
jgi:hypothetical protein